MSLKGFTVSNSYRIKFIISFKYAFQIQLAPRQHEVYTVGQTLVVSGSEQCRVKAGCNLYEVTVY